MKRYFKERNFSCFRFNRPMVETQTTYSRKRTYGFSIHSGSVCYTITKISENFSNGKALQVFI